MRTLRTIIALGIMVAGLPLSAYAATPIAASFSTTVAANRQNVVQLQGSDADGTALVYATTSSPAHGTLSGLGSATGTLIYTPANNYAGSDSFTYTVTSGGETSSAGTVTLTVTNQKTRIIDTLSDPSGAPRSGKVTFILTQPVTSPSGLIAKGASVSAVLNGSGQFDVSVYSSRGLSPQAYYQVYFTDGTSSGQTLVGVYDIPLSTVTVNLAPYRVTDTNLAAQYTFAPLAAVMALSQAISSAVYASLTSAQIATALGYTPLSAAGIGTMALQNAPAVNITGGTLANVTCTNCTNVGSATNGAFAATVDEVINFDSDANGSGVFRVQRGGVDALVVNNDKTVTVSNGLIAPDRGAQVFNVRAYGAVCDGTTSDETPVHAALTAALAVNGTLYLPGKCKISTALTLNKSIELAGAGMAQSGLVLAAGADATVDAIRIVPPASGISTYGLATGKDNRGYYLHDFAIEAESGTPGRDAIRIDVSTSGSYLHDSVFERLYLNDLGAGSSIYMTNPGAINTDGIFRITVKESWLFDGIYGDRIGDGITIDNNTFRGLNKSLDASFVAGAGKLHFTRNNDTSNGGVHLRNGPGHVISGNFIETYKAGATGSNGYCLDLDGDVAQLVSITVNDNIFGTGGTANAVGGVRINNATFVFLKNNYVNTPGGTYVALTTASAGVVVAGLNLQVGAGSGYQINSATRWFNEGLAANTPEFSNQPGMLGYEKIRSGQTFTSFVEASTSQTLTLTDQLTTLAFFASSALDANLPQQTSAANMGGRLVRILKGDASANAITIRAFSGDTINGATTYTLTTQYQCVELQASNVPTRWFVVGKCN